MDGREITGWLLHGDVVKALSQGAGNRRVAEFVRRDCLLVDDNERLDRAPDKMQACGCPTLLVQRQAELVGILSEEHLGLLLMLHSSVHRRSSETPPQAASEPARWTLK